MGDSIASYRGDNPMEKLCNLKKREICQQAADADLFVEMVNMNEEFIDSMFSRNLDLTVYIEKEEFEKTINLTHYFDATRFTLSLEEDYKLE